MNIQGFIKELEELGYKDFSGYDNNQQAKSTFDDFIKKDSNWVYKPVEFRKYELDLALISFRLGGNDEGKIFDQLFKIYENKAWNEISKRSNQKNKSLEKEKDEKQKGKEGQLYIIGLFDNFIYGLSNAEEVLSKHSKEDRDLILIDFKKYQKDPSIWDRFIALFSKSRKEKLKSWIENKDFYEKNIINLEKNFSGDELKKRFTYLEAKKKILDTEIPGLLKEEKILFIKNLFDEDITLDLNDKFEYLKAILKSDNGPKYFIIKFNFFTNPLSRKQAIELDSKTHLKNFSIISKSNIDHDQRTSIELKEEGMFSKKSSISSNSSSSTKNSHHL